MEPKPLFKALLRVTSSLLFAAIFYIGWMAVFIPTFKTESSLIRGIGWLSAPLMTAAGFTVGIWIAERRLTTRKVGFVGIFAWPLIGCAVGAGILFWFGPMKWLQKLMFHTPVVYAFIWASAIYHDRIWYPRKGRKLVDDWLANSPWGQLFATYEPGKQPT